MRVTWKYNCQVKINSSEEGLLQKLKKYALIWQADTFSTIKFTIWGRRLLMVWEWRVGSTRILCTQTAGRNRNTNRLAWKSRVCVCVCVCVCDITSVMSNSLRPYGLYVAHQFPLSMGFSRQRHRHCLKCICSYSTSRKFFWGNHHEHERNINH